MLQPLNAQLPLGEFDCLDTELVSFKGGELCTLTGVSLTGFDQATRDSFDGYVGPVAMNRPVVTRTLTATSRPLFLSDDGTFGYGTLFGTVVGATAGQGIVGGQYLGVHSAAASGKMTCWSQPGLYSITTDAVDLAADGLVVTNTSLNVSAGLTYSRTGLLTPVGSAAATACGGPVVGRLCSFDTNGSFVNTPSYLISALNSPSSNIAVNGGTKVFSRIIFWFNGGTQA